MHLFYISFTWHGELPDDYTGSNEVSHNNVWGERQFFLKIQCELPITSGSQDASWGFVVALGGGSGREKGNGSNFGTRSLGIKPCH